MYRLKPVDGSDMVVHIKQKSQLTEEIQII